MLTGSPSSKFGLLTWLAVVLSTVLGVGTLTAPASAEERKGGSWTVTRQTGAPGRLSADVRLDGTDGTLSFAVRRDGATVLEPAPLGIVTDAADLTTGLRLRDRDTREVTERYTTTTGKERRRTARMTQTRFSFTGDGGARLDLDVRVSDDGVAYRYVLPDEDGVTVLREASAFQLPAASPAWLMPYTVNYERPRNETTAGGAAAGDYGYPSLFRSGAGFVLLTESDVDGRYAGSRLTHEAGSARYTVRLADERISSVGPLATPGAPPSSVTWPRSPSPRSSTTSPRRPASGTRRGYGRAGSRGRGSPDSVPRSGVWRRSSGSSTTARRTAGSTHSSTTAGRPPTGCPN